MKTSCKIAAIGIALGLSACGPSDVASRNAAVTPNELAYVQSGSGTQKQRIVLVSQYDVVAINVSVPDTLSVSEANVFYPVADIVWHGEPPGNRHEQVRQIFTEAFGLGTARMKSGPKVALDVRVERFHAVTDKTRNSFGGVHAMRFELTVRDAETGAILEPARVINADVRASGGAAAKAEEAAGRTQRVVIIEKLRATIRRELSVQRPHDYVTSRAPSNILHSVVDLAPE